MRDWIETSAGPLPPSMQGVTLWRRAPHAVLRHDVVDISGYQENVVERVRQLQPARLEIPWIISFGAPFAIRIGEASQPAVMDGSFVAGLVAGPALIESGGGSACISVSFTPSGARRFFDLPMSEIAGGMARAEDLLGNTVAALRERLGDEADWERRFDIVEAFLASRLLAMARTGSPATWAYERLRQSHGMERIEAIASQLGWSRKHLAARFHDEIGLSPKTIAQMMRFNHALAHARRRTCGWAELAGQCGYADQAHLIRDFTRFSGESPTAWGNRLAL
ncbi:helix-turn-helix domain-containing protein [Achromobacter sp. Marseille-Q0513]|uniref:helix-turn-helix domain-containing protein n=1 Tax=Achromobacter sp. Marseille-Q0513 TaxID=2829161 RepID=UPI001B9EA789|nr:helix-turn-helix domain-containing protein [Achromobacter sp. Marseille-Q0513]MBR8653200.1 helix-turn-helix domain-containing protein [Achromobacter sp. Marseille-Q0513]